MIKKLLKCVSSALADDYYNVCLARDNRSLQDNFRKIVRNSKQYFYLCCGSRNPILLRDEFRDMLLDKICMKEPGLDMKFLIHEDLFHALNYYDATFRTTKARGPDFVASDAGSMIMTPQAWNLCKMRDEYPGENIRDQFLAAYNAAKA